MREGYSLQEWAQAHADSGMVQAREALLLIEERDRLVLQLECVRQELASERALSEGRAKHLRRLLTDLNEKTRATPAVG